MASPLLGAWELVDDPDWLELEIFTETHYCNLQVRKDRKGFEGEEPSVSEQAEAYRGMGAGAGTYTLSGSTLTRSEDLNRNPNGIPITCEIIWIDENNLKYSWDASGEEFTYRRLS